MWIYSIHLPVLPLAEEYTRSFTNRPMCWTGEPVKRVDLAESTIRLSGLITNKDIKITYTGIRKGEKLEEVLFTKKEKLFSTKEGKIFVTKKKVINKKALLFGVQKIKKLSEEGKISLMKKEMKKLITLC